MPFIRPCIKCDELFKPAGKFSRICDDCHKKQYLSRMKKYNCVHCGSYFRNQLNMKNHACVNRLLKEMKGGRS